MNNLMYIAFYSSYKYIHTILFTSAWAILGGYRPHIIESKVDLPEPDTPTLFVIFFFLKTHTQIINKNTTE